MKYFLLNRRALQLMVCLLACCLLHQADASAQGTGLSKCYKDKDRDGYGDPNDYVLADEAFPCISMENNYVKNGLDCNDQNWHINPNTVWYQDADNDYIPTGPPFIGCTPPSPAYKAKTLFSLINEYEGRTSHCEGVEGNQITTFDRWRDFDDNRHDGPLYFYSAFYLDKDGDGAVSSLDEYYLGIAPPNYPYVKFRSNALGNLITCGLQVDCDDNDPTISTEQGWYLDGDGDGYPLASTPEMIRCLPPSREFYKMRSELIALTPDCDDRKADVRPGLWYEDKDGDGFTSGRSVFGCNPGPGYIFEPDNLSILDCDDNDPDATWQSQFWFEDADGDGYGGKLFTGCKRPAGYFHLGELKGMNDCDDQDKLSYPGAIERCNGKDDNCDGKTDETWCCPAGNILYVNSNATGANNGTSWASAFINLQDALETARRCSSVTEIWVAGGTYYPDQGGGIADNDGFGSFHLRDGLAVYGGFAGTETALSQRNLTNPRSILSGNIQASGMIKSLRVVTLENINSHLLLDGFTIRDGANNIIFPELSGTGAGMWVGNSSSNSIRIVNCLFTANRASFGAAITIQNAKPHFINCVISGNTTGNGYGTIWINNASPVWVNCTIANNQVFGSNAVVISNTGSSAPLFLNSIVRGTSPAITGGMSTAQYSIIQNPTPWPGVDNLNTDPLFANEGAGDLHLRQGSPAINAGGHAFINEERDIEGNWRKIGRVDIGAYESPFECNNPSLWVIDNDKDGYYEEAPITACAAPGPQYLPKDSVKAGDCNDNDATLHPQTIWYRDADGDGYYAPGMYTQPNCTSPGPGYVTSTKGRDCDDTDPARHEEALLYKDTDGDGYHDPFYVQFRICAGTPGYIAVTKGVDCNDNDAAIQTARTYYTDADKDGYGGATATTFCTATTPPGYATNNKDCDDSNPSVYPGSLEICGNKKDDNCDGRVDDKICLPCLNALLVFNTNNTGTTSTFNWIALFNTHQWEIRYKKAIGSGPWTTLPAISGNKRSLQVTGLSPKTLYQWQIRANCGSGWTSYSLPGLFGTNGNTALRETNNSNEQTREGTQELTISTTPNPSSAHFYLTVSSTSKEKVLIQVSDLAGRMIEVHRANPGQTLQLGYQYKPGIYIVYVTQGKRSKQVKIVKTPY